MFFVEYFVFSIYNILLGKRVPENTRSLKEPGMHDALTFFTMQTEVVASQKRSVAMLAKRNDSWGLFNPWRTVNDLHKEFLGLFDDLNEGLNRFRANYPKVNLTERKKEIIIQLALPGYCQKDIDIEVVSNFLRVRAERFQPVIAEGERFLHQERSFGKLEESIKLSAKVNSSKVKAKFIDGILTIIMPKQETEKAKIIKITK